MSEDPIERFCFEKFQQKKFYWENFFETEKRKTFIQKKIQNISGKNLEIQKDG